MTSKMADRVETTMADKPILIHDALRLLRVYCGLSQIEMAQKLGISQSMISDVERGSRSVSIDLLQSYADVTGVRVSQLLFFAEELDEPPAHRRGRFMIAGKVLALLEKLAPKDLTDAGSS